MDIKTILINATIFNFIFSFALLMYHKNKKDIKGLPELITAFILMGFGFLILSLDNYLPSFITIIVANILIMFGVVKVLHGILKFKKIENINYLFDYSILGVFILLLFAYTYLMESVSLRIIVFSIFQILYYVKIIFYLNNNNDKDKEIIKTESLSISLYFIISIAIGLIRVLSILIGANISDFMSAFSISIISILPFIVTLGIFWILSSLSQNDLITNSMTDSLTGLYNREAIMKLAKIEINKQKRTSENMGIVFGDIDFFKNVNSKNGHETGDRLLIAISNLLRDSLRGYDLVSRYGRGEFLILVPDINLIDLYKLAEKIRAKIENKKFDIDENTISVTMSFGITIFNSEEDEFMNGINRAHAEMSNAKQSGRNKICFI